MVGFLRDSRSDEKGPWTGCRGPKVTRSGLVADEPRYVPTRSHQGWQQTWS
jgi:hypothetical protein